MARLIAAMLDVRPALETYTPEEIGDLMDAFDVKIYFNSIGRSVRFELTLAPELAAGPAAPVRLTGRRAVGGSPVK